ncbi:MAG: MotA/TolQ/ExbB proton channel family protein [Gammaproteobacteria bacterium]
MRTGWLLFFATWTFAAVAEDKAPASLGELVKRAQEERVIENQALEAREREFREARAEQQARIEKLRAELAQERALGEDLKRRYTENDAYLSVQQEALREKTGSLGELFGVARQVAKDAQSLLSRSLVSVERPGRDALPARLAERKDNPTSDELEQLWLGLLGEMEQSGKVSRFKTAVTLVSGEQRPEEVVRIGSFNIVGGGRYLHYLPETGRLVELARQPAGRYLSLAADLQRAGSGVKPIALDPSRGSILSLMVESPGFIEHIQRAGVIGYVILALGGIALLIVAERFVRLIVARRKFERERVAKGVCEDNALGRLRHVFHAHPALDADHLALKLDEVMAVEAPRFKRLLPTLAVFATAAPLFGLLGTVAGMIETFESMALFGAGDPKLVSSGISLALVATELGLLVAIPILLLHSWLHSSSNRLIQILEEEVAALVAKREEQRYAHAA